MTIEKNLPSYEELFGNLNFKQGDEARSVYSPAAYLTDLIQLLEDYFGSPDGGSGGDGNRFDLDARRSDIKDTLLDGDNTFTQIPYLDIVNDILQRKIEGPNSTQDTLELLKTQVYPLNLPLNFDYERLKKFLGYLNVREGEIQDLFSLTTDLDRQARNILGLSAEEVSYFLKDRSADEGAIRGAFNLVKNQDLNVKPGASGTGTGSKPALATVSQFLLTTGLSGKELRELLFQNLSITAVNAANLSERVLATNFFINQGLGGFTTLSADESAMVWQPAESPAAAGSQPEIPISWFDRCDRFIRLARKTGYSFSDLDLVLRNCCGNQLNRESLQVMALIKKLLVDYQLPVDVICAFFSNISTTGIGDLDEPGDLFNRTFNNRLAFLEKKYIAQSEFIPQSYILKIGQTDANRLTIINDILQDESKEFRKRLQRTLQISDADLMLIIAKFRARNALDPTYTTSVNNNIQLPGLSLIFRMVKIAEILDLSIVELFDLFDLLERDRTIRTSSHFRILFPYPVQELNCYRIIDDPRTYAREALWLVQILIAIASWMRTTDFSTADLKFIQSGNLSSAEHATLSNTLIQMLDQLVQAFLPLALNPGTFVSDQFDARSSRVIYETLLAHDSLVSVQDNRIVRFDEDAARRAAESALARLGGVTKKDFKGLNISGKMADKMYRNLVIYEIINADGEIVADKLPADVGDFSIASDFSDQRSSLFNIVHDLVVAEQSNFLAASDSDQLPDKQELGVMLYLSDLAPLNLPLQQVNELMDNLIFNAYLDEEGNLSDPTLFADSENEDAIEVNTPLTRDHARIVFELIQKGMADFLHTPFKLESSIFHTLPLSDVEVQDLIANLKFNGYIDDAGMVIDKQIFFNLPQKKFKLAPEFYWYQGPILEAIQAALDADRMKYYHIDSETLADIAEEIVAEMCFNAVQAEYLEDGTISESQRDFFANPDNSATFDLGRYFTPGFNQAVFARLAAIQQWFDRHHLTDKALAALGLDPNAIANLYSLLVQDGFLDTDHSIPPERYAYFLTVNNALTFSISGYDDYNKDIFFALQGVAKDMQQRQDEIVTALKGVAANQESAVMDTLAGGFEIDSESIRIICGYLFYNPPSLAEVLLVPALASVGPDGRVSALPGEYDFDRQLLRIAQFVQLAKKFQFGAGEVEVAFSDLNLVEKFPEDLVLPTGMTSFDALLPQLDGKIYLFKGNQYWAYSSATYALVENAAPLALLSRLFAGLDHIDAAFTDPMGNAWIISGTSYFIRNKGSNTWTPTERRWGLVDNNFDKAGPIDAAFTNRDGVSYLFSADQFIRYSGDSLTNVDPGFPKRIQGHWPGEIGAEKLPDRFSASIDAGFESPDGQTILFKDDKFVRFDDSDPTAQEQDIASFWGRVFNKFSDLTHLDAAFSDGQNVYLFLNDYVIRYEDQVENDQVMMSEGFPRRLPNFIPGLPEDFEYGIDAIFKGADNKVYAFTNNQFLVLSAAMDQVESQGDLVSKWGLVRNNIQTFGEIDAAFTGLDGYTYLFSGDQYFRYSGKDFTRVNEGFPRTISTDWGGLESITSAFILDGKTYLFAKGKAEYIRYSTHDYTIPDANFPKPFDQEEYWNLPASLVTSGFSEPDAVLIGLDHATYLFKGKQFVAFDHLQRWWSEPQTLASKWHGLEFDKIDAAFSGLDGKTYLFSGKQFVRYSDPTYSKVDDRYPRNISTHWGLVANNIAQSRRIDSAVVVDSRVMTVDASGNQVETTTRHTYLFCGNQFFRYAGTDYTFVEEGYPLTIRTALQEEPRFKNLKAPWQTVVDAAFADERNVYLVQGNNLQIISDSASRSYDFQETKATTNDGHPWHTLRRADGSWTGLGDVQSQFTIPGPVTVVAATGDGVAGETQFMFATADGHLWHTLRRADGSWTGLGDVQSQFAIPAPVRVVAAAGDGITGETQYMFATADGHLWHTLRRADGSWTGLGDVQSQFTIPGPVTAVAATGDGVAGETQFMFATADGHPWHTLRRADGSWTGLGDVQSQFTIPGPVTAVAAAGDGVAGETQFMFATADGHLWHTLRRADGSWTGLGDVQGQFAIPAPVRVVATAGDSITGETQYFFATADGQAVPAGEVQIEAAVIDEGSLYFQDQETWFLRNNPEMETAQQVEELPPILRDVPEFYQTGLSAILQGTDENTYLFKGPNCYDLLLHNAYPTGEAWGTVRNQIVEENRVEAAFLGQDGKTYLFCGDQFVSYLPGTVVNMANNAPLIDGLPQPIADHWGGLTNVRYAYVQNGVTYLAEKPDEDGNFHIVRYSTAEYSKPDKGYPRMVGFDWWEIPQIYQEDGFTRVDAVLTDENNLFLIGGQEFIQFNYQENLWNYARPLNLVWRGLAFNDDNFSSILAAFRGSDSLVYFFAQGAFAVVPHNIENPAPAGSTAPLLEIKLHWGHVDNHFADSGIVDAAFVWNGRETYLFSGPEYVKYSTNDYRHVDEGYPKLIWQSLRQEEPFAQLPGTFESTMQSRASQGKGLSAAVANKGSVYLFINNTLLVVSKDLQRSVGIDVLGKMTNRIVENNAIDAAYVNAQGQLLLLAGDQVFKYSDPNFDSVDEGYPRKIREVALEEGFASIDPMFTYDLDAVLRAGTAGTIYLFKGQQYAGSNDPTTQKQIKADWGKVRNNFVPVGTATNMSVDAAFVSPNGMTYLFKGDQFIRYANFAQVFVDEGFPLPIRDNWGNLPAPYEAGIDGGFVFEGKTYLLRDGVIAGDGEYVRFSRPDYRKTDTIYPQKIADRVARWGDYLLDDMKLLSFFKQKVDETSGGTHSITDFLNVTTADQLDPYATLQAMFGWDISEVKWIQRNKAFLSVIDPEETRLDLEIIERMTQIFGTTRKLGADPSKVYAEVWHNWFDSSNSTDVKTAADNLYRYLANNTSATDWATLQQQIHDELNLIQRDIFIPFSIALDSSLTRPKDLYDLLLIDVLMGSQAKTSKVKEAISALQLYFHRYFVNLEQPPGSSPAQDPQTRELLKERWKWLKNYQMWEANRMVFLYPENYIRPELRSTKTPQFKDLESALLQGELNLDTAEAAFTSYLEDFGIVSNLKIAGANVYEVGDFQNGGEKVLVLFGHTRMEPRQYYYRTASYSKQAEPNTDDLVVWSPWEKVDQTIDSDRVFPIMVNGRLMVFWIEIKDIEEPEAKFKSKQATETTSPETISQVNVAQKQLLHQAEIKYSLRKHDAQWTPPQQTKKGIDLVYKIDAAYCEGDNDSVIVTFCGEYCQKTRQDTQEVEAKRIEEFDEFKNLPESFKSGIDAATVFKGKRYLFKGGQCVIQDVVQETTGQALQSLSIGDLIGKDPNAALLTVSPGTYGTDQFITDQSGDNLQKAEVLLSEGVSAAFGLTADILTLVDTQGHYSFYQEQDGKLYPMSSILILSLLVTELGSGVTTLSFPQMISTLTMREGQFRRPDAVFKQGQTFYVIRDGQYECYNQVGDDLVPLDGFPKPLRGNLNFNMDNFFNHLHLENSHDLVFLSYTSPKDQLLLYGKLKADFTFQEIPIQSDRALLMVLGWNTLLQNNVRDYSPYRSVAIASSVSEFITNLTAQRANIAPVLAVEAAIAQLNQALDSARQILPQETQATTNDGHPWHTMRRADGSWTGLGDVQSAITIPDAVTAVAAAGDGVAGETQYMFATADGHLWHTIRHADGSWQPRGDVQGQFAIPGPVTVIAATGDGITGETQYMFATNDGRLWHTLRRADGSWTGLEDVQGKITIPGPVTTVAAAGDATAGETQYMFATADGHLWHTIRRADGSWQPLGDVQGQFAIPAPVRAVAGAGDGITGETQYFFATADGQDVPAVDQLQIKILSNVQAISNVLAPFQNQDPLLTEIKTLLEFVPALGPAIDKVKAAQARQKQKTLDALTGVINTGQQIVTQTNTAITAITPSIKGDIATVVQSVAAYNLSTIQPDAASHDATYQSFKNFLTVIQGSIPVWGSLLGSSNDGSSNDNQLQSILAGANSMILAGTNQIEEFKAHNEAVRSDSSNAITMLGNIQPNSPLSATAALLDAAIPQLGMVENEINSRSTVLGEVNLTHQQILGMATGLVKAVKEQLLGTFDLFPPQFGIAYTSNFSFSPQLLNANTSNFSFSASSGPNWYCFEAKDGAFLCRPLDDTPGASQDPQYEIIRLTTTVTPRLSSILFAQGIKGLLSVTTQEQHEAPSFDPGPGSVQFNRNPGSKFLKGLASDGTSVYNVPVSDTLDFHGASGIYYEELFFHAPFLIAQTLNTAQKFEEAKMWYEFIFDPTQVGSPWNYLPFRTTTEDGHFLIDQNQIKRYLDDPFDPHAIAALRPTAYQKAIVMSYIDNLLDWGDMLFRQYTAESIDEARMLYTLTSDLLGERPEDLGTMVLSPPKKLVELAITREYSGEYEFVVQPAGGAVPSNLIGDEPITIIAGTPNDSVGLRYFFVPENGVFLDYWMRGADRLFKIRNSLNIDGQAQPLPLFEPPINPMDLVQAVARGVSLEQLISGLAVTVPAYRFEFLAARAQNLAQKLIQYGNELLAALEKKDAEALSQMQTRQEGDILKMTIDIYQAQIDEAEQTILNLQESQRSAQQRIQLYQQWITNGRLPEEISQIALLSAATALQYVSSVLKIGATIAHATPNANLGPFIIGVTEGGSNVGNSLNSAADIVQAVGQGLSMTGEILGMQAQFKRTMNDWDLQLKIAQSEDRQIGYQLSGARIAKLSAEYNMAVLRKQIEQNQSIQTFLKEKFSSQDLYLWMISQTAGLYYQTYQIAFETARMAEKAFQFERGLQEQEASFITGGYWDSQRKGLLAGEQLTLDLDRMEQAFVKTDERRLEITREVSLLELDPLVFLRLKLKGSCEFSLDEAFFDYDFPGHYARQIKTIAVEFDVPNGKTVYATLTQLSHQTVLQPDPKAVKFLLAPKDEPPATIRSNWRSSQQVALSHHDQYQKNNGMFELNYNSDRYLPFEGTGAVSRWKLELNGKKGSIDLRELVDITIHLEYTARQGGAVFAQAVKGTLKPYQAMRFFDFIFDFPQDWKDFLDGDSTVLTLTFTRDQFPGMSSSKISGIFTHYNLSQPDDQASTILNGNDTWVLTENAYLDTTGLSIGPKGSDLTFEYRGDKKTLQNIQLVFSYTATVS